MASTDKYDRQLRLWGPHGQKALMTASILLLGADAVGAETLKNLVLPGVGSFMIVDDAVVNESDLGVNFFVDGTWNGKSRAEAVSHFLCEMNPDVEGKYMNMSIEQLLSSDELANHNFSLVIASNLPEKILHPVAAMLQGQDTPLLVQQSYGLLGLVRIQTFNHFIIESRPDSEKIDLRISHPFPELDMIAAGFDFSTLDSRQHSHIPFVVILMKAMTLWKAQHDGRLPANAVEKEHFKSSIIAMRRNADEVNFIEAIKYAYLAYSSTDLPWEVQELVDAQSQAALSADSADFSFLLRALEHFLRDRSNVPPLTGKLPDMTATTDYFLQLQQAYQNKAAEDRSYFSLLLRRLLTDAGKVKNSIADEVVDMFCKNIANLRIITTRSLDAEWNEPAVDAVSAGLSDPYADEEQTPVLWYLALRAAHAFFSAHGRWPGACQETGLAADVDGVMQHLFAIKESFETAGDLLSRKHAEEIVRYAGMEIHSISALIGGIASQEAVKLITHQYVCINNTYIFNGIAGCGCKYEL